MGRSDVSPPLALRLALAGAWHVVRGRSLAQFPRVLRLLEAVGRAAPGAVRFRHGARLRLGLQAAVVVRMLQEAQPDGKILDAIDSFFPEGDGAAMAGHGLATPRDLALVEEAQESFRELVLALLGDSRRRAAYLRGPARREYGEPFLQALEGLFYEFLQRLESALPPPDLTKLQEVVWSQSGPGARPRELPILSRYLVDMGHAHRASLPRPLRRSCRQLEPAPRPASRSANPRPGLRRLRPLRTAPLEFIGDVISDSDSDSLPRRKGRVLPLPRRAMLTADADREGDRDRHRAHRQGTEPPPPPPSHRAPGGGGVIGGAGPREAPPTHPIIPPPGGQVERIKERVEEKEGIPPQQQRLIYSGKQMNDEKTAADYKIQGGSVLHLVLALRGGGARR